MVRSTLLLVQYSIALVLRVHALQYSIALHARASSEIRSPETTKGGKYFEVHVVGIENDLHHAKKMLSIRMQ